MSVLHFSYASEGGASRAGRRASHACRMAGLASSFAFVEGKRRDPGDIQVARAKKAPSRADAETRGRLELAQTLSERIQWGLIPERRTSQSNTLFSVPYPGVDVAGMCVFETADIVHLHWPTWALTPRALGDWLSRGKVVFWTLHDMWPMTGGCHYAGNCRQYESLCMKCPQLTDDLGLVSNSFDEKRNAYGARGSLVLISPSRWLADAASRSEILRGRRIEVVRNPVELDVFRPCEDRDGLRRAFGIRADDFALMMGSGDLGEKRKGVALLLSAINAAVLDGSLAAALPVGARVHLLLIGKNGDLDLPPAVRLLSFGEISDDAVLADILSVADVVATPSLEDNHPNMIVEGMACGTPVIAYNAGGIAEMIEHEATGLIVDPVGSVPALKAALVHFARTHFQSNAMRTACRARAETHADPAAIGRQLRRLYEEALGRSVDDVKPELTARAHAAFANLSAAPDADVSSFLLRFPANLAVASRASDPTRLCGIVVSPSSASQTGEPRISLTTVRTYHEHHSARSGPAQFLRFLPNRRYSTDHYAAPLGSGLAADAEASFRKAGVLMGARGFAQQGNSWLAEAELFIACAHRAADIVHFIDADIAGMLLPAAPASVFKNGVNPAFVATFHQPEQTFLGMVNGNHLARFDGVIALCRAQRDFLSHLLSPDNVVVIPHGIDDVFFCPVIEGARRLGKTKSVRLLMVGHWLRDLTVALGALSRLKMSEFTFELRVVSPRFVANVSDPSIKVLKGLSDEELREEYRSADLLYLPLMDATANNALLEAMACGLPIVSTAVGGVPETVGEDAGVLCRPGDAEDFAGAVLQLLRSPDRYAACSLAGRRRAEALSWARIGGMHHEFYERLLRQRSEALARR